MADSNVGVPRAAHVHHIYELRMDCIHAVSILHREASNLASPMAQQAAEALICSAVDLFQLVPGSLPSFTMAYRSLLKRINSFETVDLASDIRRYHNKLSPRRGPLKRGLVVANRTNLDLIHFPWTF
eukprot:GABV01004295.1.p1 GENE.GABV01004295.1~~GABV01004295.1.p1  ORF type:complete len:127 (+),score=28.51 GABV01004295.1:88-468(+)